MLHVVRFYRCSVVLRLFCHSSYRGRGVSGHSDGRRPRLLGTVLLALLLVPEAPGARRLWPQLLSGRPHGGHDL